MFTIQMGFSYLEFKIKLIRQIPVFDSQPTDSQSEVITHYTEEPTVSGRHRKANSTN